MSDVVKTNRVGGIYEVTLDRPKANAIDLFTSREMGEVFKEFRDDSDQSHCRPWHYKRLA